MAKKQTTAGTLDRAQIKASLEAHNASFDELLKHIPAKHYIRPDSDDEDARPEQPKGKLTKAQRRALAKAKQDEELRQAKNDAKRKARLARYDPDEPKTIAEIQAAKLAGKGKKRASDAMSDDEDGDSSDGELNGQEWQENDDDEADSPNETDFADSDDEDGDVFELNEEGVIAGKATASKGAAAKQDGPAPTITELREKLARRIADIQAQKRGKTGKGAAAGASAAAGGADVGEEQDGSDDDDEDDEGEGEVRSKDDLLAERRRRAALRDNRRKKLKERMKQEKSDGAKKRAMEPSNGRKGGGKANAADRDGDERAAKRSRGDSAGADSTAAMVPYSSELVASTSTSTDPSSLTFSNFDFASNSERAADASLTPQALKKMQAAAGTLKKNRHALPKDANQALEILQKRKERLDALDPEKREKKEDKERWEKVLLKAEGEKVRDDETRLKKMAKRQEREKRKSAKAWSDRKATVEKTISDKVAKRNANLAARKQAVKDKKMGVKKSKTAAATGGGKKMSSTSGKSRSKGRPGFEGGGRKKK